MSKKALEEEIKAVIGIPAQDQGAGTVNGAGIDTKDFEEAMILLQVGDATSGTVDVTIEESDDNSSFSAITGAVFPQVDSSNDQDIYVGRVSVKNFKRYIRVVSVVATNAIELSATVLLGKHDGLSPVTQVNSASFAVDYV